MAQAQSGDIVRVHYRGTLSDGTEFDSSRGREPLEFQVRSGQVIPGFERQVEGMAVGGTSVVTIPADEAYGPRDERQIQEIPRNAMPEDLILEVGAGLTATTRDGKEIPLTVVALTDDTVTVDGNHPLAGRDLTFELELVEIVASPNKSGFGV